MDKPIIEVKNLKKQFEEKVILKDVNISFKKGESVAILGSNGAGKSTFLRMICGLTSISEGEVIRDRNLKFNYIPENYSKINLTVNEYLKSMAEMDKIDKSEFKNKVSELYKEFNLEELRDTSMKNLSKGSLQKVAIIQAFLKEADVLLLDEPLTGLDINSQERFIVIVKRLVNKGVTVIMSCHDDYLVNELCTRVLRIENKDIYESENKKLNEELYDTMIFINRDSNTEKINSIVDDKGVYSVDASSIKLKIKMGQSNDVLLEMIKNGYRLKKFN